MRQTAMPKKSLGQNFLRDPQILSKITDFAEIKNTDIVLEVGPGEGLLTQILLERAGKVIVVEKDESLAASLKIKFYREIKDEKLEVVTQDILNLEIQNIFSPQAHKCTDISLLRNSSCSAQSASQGISELALKKYFERGYVLVGNIPYYITGALFKKFLENPPGGVQPKSITFVIQKEVAERIMARDGKESILSISVKAYGEPKYGGLIKAGSFYPKPNVDSAIISIVGISREKFSTVNPAEPSSLSTDKSLLAFSSSRLVSLRKARSESSAGLEKKFFEILKTGFAHKRKLLIRNLGEIAGGRDLKEIFKKCGIGEKARAEDLKVEDWINLTREF